MSRATSLRAVLLVLAAALAPLASARAGVVVNEIDYDQPGTDTAEFIELYNNGPGNALLSEYEIVLYNGAAAGAPYDTIPLPAVTLPPGGCFVVCGNAANVPGCHLDVAPNENLIQNGAPDAVGLKRLGVLVDVVSYEGSTIGATEGTGTTAADDNVTPGVGLSRSPDGADTDDNNADFSLRPISPASGCTNQVPGAGPLPAAAAALLAAGLGARLLARRRG